MKNYATVSLPAVLACLLGTCATGVLTLAVIIVQSFVPGLKLLLSYYEALNIPVLSVLFPVIGMVLLAPVALYLAFKREAPARERETLEAEQPAAKEPDFRLLKAA